MPGLTLWRGLNRMSGSARVDLLAWGVNKETHPYWLSFESFQFSLNVFSDSCVMKTRTDLEINQQIKVEFFCGLGSHRIRSRRCSKVVENQSNSCHCFSVHQCFSTFLLPRNPTQASRSLTEPHELIRESSDVREDEAIGCLRSHLPSRALRAESLWGRQRQR